MTIHNRHKKFGKDQTCISRDMLVDRQAHRQTDRQTDRHGHHNTMLPYQGQSNNCTNPNWHRMMLPQSTFQMEGSKARGTKSLTTLNTVLQYTS